MPNMDWAALSRKSRQKFGTYGEYYAKMEFASYGLDVFTAEVDDHGVDFVVRGARGYHEIQVKSVQDSTGYVFMRKSHFDPSNPRLHLLLLLFRQGQLPVPYLIPAAAWQQQTPLFRDRDHSAPGQVSPPEYGLNLSQKNLPLLEPYALQRVISTL